MPGYPTAGSPATVTLSSAGAEPRVPLRFKVAAGQKEAFLMTMTMGLAMNMEGMSMPMDMPTMKMSAETTVTNVAPNGDITYEMAFTKVEVEAAPGADPAMAQMLQAGAGELTSIKGLVTMSSRGINKSTTLNLEKITDPAMKQMLTGMSGQFESLSMPMPEEAVGVGAKWEVRQATNSGGATIFQKVLCEVVSIDANGATIKAQVEQTAPPQSVANPAAPGMTMNIEKVTGKGAGTTTFKFANLSPTSEMTSSTTLDAAVDMGGQTMKMAVTTNIKMSVAPEKKQP